MCSHESTVTALDPADWVRSGILSIQEPPIVVSVGYLKTIGVVIAHPEGVIGHLEHLPLGGLSVSRCKTGDLRPLRVSIRPPGLGEPESKWEPYDRSGKKSVERLCLKPYKHKYLSRPGRIHLLFCWLVNLWFLCVEDLRWNPICCISKSFKGGFFFFYIYIFFPFYNCKELQSMHPRTDQSRSADLWDHHVKPALVPPLLSERQHILPPVFLQMCDWSAHHCG